MEANNHLGNNQYATPNNQYEILSNSHMETNQDNNLFATLNSLYETHNPPCNWMTSTSYYAI